MKTDNIFLLVLTLTTSLFSATLSKEATEQSLVIYNSNIALVHEQRELSLRKEDKRFIYDAIAKSINVDSLHVKLDPSIKILSQRYQDNQFTLENLLEDNLGKSVTVHNKNSNYKEAMLISYDKRQSVVKQKNNFLIIKNTDIIFNSSKKKFLNKPSLIFDVQTSRDIDSKIELDYLINDINFQTNYILDIDENSSSLTGFINIDNHSGKEFKNIRLSLLAGDVNRVHSPVVYKEATTLHTMSDNQEISLETFSGYHFYTIPFKVSLEDKEKTYIEYLDDKSLHVEKELQAYMSNPLYVRGEKKVQVDQELLLQGLSKPLIKGVVRTYSKLDGQTVLIGETHISNTPKNTPLKLKIGKDFDLSVFENVISRDDSKNVSEVEMQYKIVNSSNETKTLRLYVPFNVYKGSEIKSAQKYGMTKGNLVTFTIQVDANKSQSFRVNFKSRR